MIREFAGALESFVTPSVGHLCRKSVGLVAASVSQMVLPPDRVCPTLTPIEKRDRWPTARGAAGSIAATKADESDEVVLLLYRFTGGHTSTRLSFTEHTRVVGAMVVEESSGRLRRVSTDCCRLLIEVCRGRSSSDETGRAVPSTSHLVSTSPSPSSTKTLYRANSTEDGRSNRKHVLIHATH